MSHLVPEKSRKHKALHLNTQLLLFVFKLLGIEDVIFYSQSKVNSSTSDTHRFYLYRK